MPKDKSKHINDTCPVTTSARLLSDTHVILIIRDLLTGPKRFCHIGLDADGQLQMSTRTLTKKLLELEQCGIVERKEYKEYPPRVEYALTRTGKKVEPIIDAMRTFGKQLQKK